MTPNRHDNANLDRLWSQLLSGDDPLACLVAVDPQGTVAGLAHVRPFARPLDGSEGLYLDDLFVDPAARGTGIGSAILAHLGAWAAEAGYSVVRWITADDNASARALYDRVAVATHWVTYDMAPAGSAKPMIAFPHTPLTGSTGFAHLRAGRPRR